MENSVLIDRYRKWVIQRGTETFPVTENEEGNLEIESKFALGRVNFYEDDIVELRIDMIRDQTTEFFLHFQLKDLKRAQDLYVEMEEAMRSLKDRQVVHIVLSCTSGLTTSYYAELLNAAVKTLNLNYEFKAVSYNRLESEMHGKDMLLLAPQVHFERKKLQEKYPNVLVRNIPAQTFGKYDTGEDIFKEVTGELDYQYLNLNPLQSVIIFSDKSLTADGNIDKNIEEMFKNIHDYIYRKTGQFMYIAVSGLFNDYHELPQVMDAVDTLMNNKFYETGRYIFSDNISEDTPVLVQIDDDALMKQMKQDIKMKDITFLRIHFDALCKKYRGQSNFSHIYIKFVFSNLLKDFYDNIPGADEAEFGREIDRLYKSEDFSCIMDIVNNYIDLLEKSFGKEPATSHREIETVKNYIHNHYGEEIGAQQLADMVYLAPSYLSSLFKKETGQNLSKYIKQYRMEKAKELLTDTNMKIVNISEQVGYPNVSYFVQSFREYFGVSPQKFRDQGE